MRLVQILAFFVRAGVSIATLSPRILFQAVCAVCSKYAETIGGLAECSARGCVESKEKRPSKPRPDAV